MKEILTHYYNKFKAYNQSLEKQNLFVGKAWITPLNDLQIGKIIFLDDKRILVSRKSGVTEGTWEFIPDAESIYLKFEEQNLLLKASIINEYLLSFEGNNNHGNFTLLNEKVVENFSIGIVNDKLLHFFLEILFLAVENQVNLLELKEKNVSVEDYFYENKSTIQGHKIYISKEGLSKNDVETKPIITYPENQHDSLLNFEFFIGLPQKYVVIKNGNVLNIYNVVFQRSNKGELKIVCVAGGYNSEFSEGNLVFLAGKPAPTGKYRTTWFYSIDVKDGKIV